MLRILAVVLLFLAIPATRAQQPGDDHEKVLLPLLIGTPIPGAHGSRWITTLWILNNAETPVSIHPPLGDCYFACVGSTPTLPGFTFKPLLAATADLPGIFLFVERSKASDVTYSLRVRDLSRQSQTWGTEVPVVREKDFREERIDLLGIPVDNAFRYTLRLYDVDSNVGGKVLVRVYAIDPDFRNPIDPSAPPDRFLGETTVDLRTSTSNSFHYFYPTYAQLSDFDAFASIAGVSRVRLELEPIAPVKRFWAFVSVTNNETQHVTVVTPQ